MAELPLGVIIEATQRCKDVRNKTINSLLDSPYQACLDKVIEEIRPLTPAEILGYTLTISFLAIVFLYIAFRFRREIAHGLNRFIVVAISSLILGFRNLKEIFINWKTRLKSEIENETKK